MPSRNRTLLAGGLCLLAVVVLLYSVLLGGELLLGAFVASLLLLSAAALWSRDDDPSVREVAVWVVVGALAVYGTATNQLLEGVFVAAAVYLVAWITDPGREGSVV